MELLEPLSGWQHFKKHPDPYNWSVTASIISLLAPLMLPTKLEIVSIS
jgi:hypothetical protein